MRQISSKTSSRPAFTWKRFIAMYISPAVLSPSGTAELHRPAVPTPEAETSYGMGWFVGPVNGKPVEVMYRYMDVWVIRGGSWLCVASQSTRVGGR